MQHVYVRGDNTGTFYLRDTIGSEDEKAPTLWSWRVYGHPVELPTGPLDGRQLGEWVEQLVKSGRTIRDVTETPATSSRS